MSVYDQFYDFTVVNEHIDRESPSAQVVGRLPWDKRLDIAQQLVGGLQKDGGNWRYHEPASYPYGMLGGMKVSAVDIEPLGDINQSNGNYATAKMTLHYGIYRIGEYTNDPLSITQCTTTLSGEMCPLPAGNFQWADDSTPLTDDDVHLYKTMPFVELSCKVCFAVSPLLSESVSLIGTTNSGQLSFPIAEYISDFEKDKCLFLGSSLDTICNSQGYLTVTRDLKFGIKDNDGMGWQAMLDKSGTYRKIVTADGGDPFYDSADHTQLFKIE